MPEIAAFKDGVTGFEFSMGSADSLAKVLSDNIDNFYLLDQQANNAKLKVADNYTTKSMNDRFCHLVDALNDGS